MSEPAMHQTPPEVVRGYGEEDCEVEQGAGAPPPLVVEQHVVPFGDHHAVMRLDDRRRGPRELEVPIEHRNGDGLARGRGEPLGLSVTEAARKLGVSRKQLSDIVNCRAGISPEMAIRLDKAFGGGADTWYRLQSTWEMAQALKKADRIKVERLAPAA